MNALITTVEAQQSHKQQQSQVETLRLLRGFPQGRLKAITSSPPLFNLFDHCRVGADERHHSRTLAWLLDETGNHAHGNRFFTAFAKLCGLQPAAGLTGYNVYTEFPGLESLTDIVLFRKGEFFVSIENKILAQEGDDQLNREYRDLQHYASSLCVPTDRRLAVFLTLEGRKPLTGCTAQWRDLSYAALTVAFRSVIARTTSRKLAFFVEDWLASLKTIA
jgi:hypothetical protein